ncbi:MAG: pyruvate dehydrogenase [Magnetococcales bacterium]|nr:pyruvate dehydrogenase [Magnetococcales bacterium]
MLDILSSSKTDSLTLYKRMALVRCFEKRLLGMFSQGLLMGTTHTCLGQEANAVGVVAALAGDDVVVSNHRCHGHFLAHTGDMAALMAEIMGRATGVCGGWGGSQHLCVPNKFYSNGIQGGILPMAAGLALAHKNSGSKQVVVVFIGDGTMGQGVVYETLNIASVLSLPLLIVVEDNHIAQSTTTTNVLAGSIGARAEAFGIKWQHLKAPLVEDIYGAAQKAVTKIRDGSGPQMLWLDSVRLGPHSKGDDTRPQDEVAKLHHLDPLEKASKALSPEVVDEIWLEAEKVVDEVVAKAKDAPWPQWTKTQKLVSPINSEPQIDEPESLAILNKLSNKSMLANLQDALNQILGENSDLLLFGEDVVDPYGGAFKVTDGLSTAFPNQVLGMPISEAAMVGIGGGLALAGKKAVVEIMFGDFLGLGMDQLINHAARFRGMYNGQLELPMVVRTPMGGGRGYGPTHSQTLDKHFLGIQGLTVLAPSPLHPLYPMLQGALTAKDPTLWLENKLAYSFRTNGGGDTAMVDDFYIYYAGDASQPWVVLSHTGFEEDSATIITYGGMLGVAMEAANRLLLEHEIPTRLLLPGCLSPFDAEGCMRLLADDGPLLLLEEGSSPFGFASEVIATLTEAGALNSRAVGRIGMEGPAIPASKVIEEKSLPGADAVVNCMLNLRENK